MPTNLVSMIMKFLTPDLIMKIASGLGLDQSMVQKGIMAAIPGLLGSLASSAAQPGGAKALSDMIGKQDSGLLGNLAGMLGGSNQAGLISGGTSALTSLLGGSGVSGLAGVLSKFSGLNSAGAGSLLGLLGPVVLGQLGQAQKAGGLDAGGLAKLLGDQSSNIQSAMPAGLGDLLKGAGLGGAMMSGATKMATSAVNQGVGAANQAAGAATKSMGQAADTMKSASGGGWLPWLVGLVALGLIGWYVFGKSAPDGADKMAMAPGAHIMLNGADVTNQATVSLGGLTSAIAGIKDVASAKAALPAFDTAAKDLGKLQTDSAALPADGKKALGSLVGGLIAKMTPILATASAIPGVGDVLKPALAKVQPILDALAKS